MHFRKYLVYFFVLCFLWSVFFYWMHPGDQYGSTGLPASMKEVREFDENIVFNIPETWKFDVQPDGYKVDKELIFVSQPEKGMGVNLRVLRKISPVATLEEVIAWAEIRQTSLENYHMINSESTEQGYFLEYSYGSYLPLLPSQRVCKARYTFAESGAYGIVCCSVPEVWPEVQPYCQQIIESLEVK